MARHSQPLETALLKGADKKHPERYRGEPVKVEAPLGEPFEDMTGQGKLWWFELSANTLPGVMTSADRLLFRVLCELVAEYVAAPTDFAVGKYTHLIGLAARFGLSPADRQKFTADKPKNDNPFAALDDDTERESPQLRN